MFYCLYLLNRTKSIALGRFRQSSVVFGPKQNARACVCACFDILLFTLLCNARQRSSCFISCYCLCTIVLFLKVILLLVNNNKIGVKF